MAAVCASMSASKSALEQTLLASLVRCKAFNRVSIRCLFTAESLLSFPGPISSWRVGGGERVSDWPHRRYICRCVSLGEYG